MKNKQSAFNAKASLHISLTRSNLRFPWDGMWEDGFYVRWDVNKDLCDDAVLVMLLGINHLLVNSKKAVSLQRLGDFFPLAHIGRSVMLFFG